MNTDLLFYFVLGGVMVGVYCLWYALRDWRYRRAHKEAVAAGLTEPASLHPIIDPIVCVGCSSCVAACPEQGSHPVLGIVGGKARLIEPASCIGHGACKDVCPVDAITLVFGTEKRGVDIPNLTSQFETSVAGIFIAGELGGMGLIRNAINQGCKAMDFISTYLKKQPSRDLDVVIVGAGPAGIAASLRAKELGLKFVTLEQDSLGGTVFKYPRGKLVMTAPVDLPLVGRMYFQEVRKEALLDFWQNVERDARLQINYRENVHSIDRDDGCFVVKSNVGEYRGASVLLALGRTGTPRKLGVPGEDLAKVVYRMIDPEQFRGQRVLIVGGGDSALEAAVSISEEEDTDVTLSYRGEAFGRAKSKNREKTRSAGEKGKLRIMMESNVVDIQEGKVVLEKNGEQHTLGNDAVIVNAGGILPTGFLQKTGIEVETKHGTA